MVIISLISTSFLRPDSARLMENQGWLSKEWEGRDIGYNLYGNIIMACNNRALKVTFESCP